MKECNLICVKCGARYYSASPRFHHGADCDQPECDGHVISSTPKLMDRKDIPKLDPRKGNGIGT